MRIHHLNCVSSCPLGGVLMDGMTAGVRGRLTCHCLLLEFESRLVLVDTGFGLRDVANPRSRLSGFFLFLTSPEFREEMTAIRQIERMGYDPRDVTDIVMTHLDFDHAGGLDDFPHARVHMLGAERSSAEARETMLDRMRYRPQQWSSQANWTTYRAEGERWFGFDSVRELKGLPPEILMVPLIGHTLGHAAIALRRSDDWLLYAGDAYFYYAEMDLDHPRCTPGLRFYQWMMEKDRRSRLSNQDRLRELARNHGHEIDMFCAHDVREFERITGRPAGQPAGRQSSVAPAAGMGERPAPAMSRSESMR